MNFSGTAGQLLVGIAALLAVTLPARAQESLADLASFQEGCQALVDERFETAFTHFEESWKIIQASDAGDAEENFIAARLLEALVRDGANAAAIEWVRVNPLLSPSPQTSYWIARAFQKEERFAEAADHYNLFLSATPDAGNAAHINRAVCLVRSGQAETAFDLVRKSVTPESSGESFRLAQISSAAAHYREALDYLEGIPRTEIETPTLSFPLNQLKIWILKKTHKNAAALEAAYGFINSARDPATSRLAFLLLEQLIGDEVPADLEQQFEKWESGENLPVRDAARLFRMILLSDPASRTANLAKYLDSPADPGLHAECRLRLTESRSKENPEFESLTASKSYPPDIISQIDFTKAKADFLSRSFDQAAQRFIELADAHTGEERSRNLYNSAISALKNEDTAGFAASGEALARNNPRSLLLPDLSYLGGLYFAAKGDPRAFELLNTFVRENVDHPLNIDAQLALAEIHLNQAPARPHVAEEIFERLRTRPLTLTQSERFDYTSIWIDLTSNDPAGVLRGAETFIADWPSSEYLPEVIMILACEHYELKNLSAAASNFRLISEKFSEGPYAETARFFEAKASPPNEETIVKWRHLIESGGLLVAESHHELGLLYLSIDRFEEARQEFNQILENPSADSNLHFAVMADLGFTYYLEALANGKAPDKLETAAHLFAALSNKASAPTFWRCNAAVRRGKCLEALGRAPIALEIYRSIVDETKNNTAGLPGELPPREVEWVFRAGFAAIDILSSEENWIAAIKVADALSEKNGPRAIEAIRLAERLRLKHWIWD